MRRVIFVIVFVVMALLLVTTYFSYDPSVSRLFPRCFFKVLTGYDCPGCGTQRALHALLHGDIVGAWHFNRALIVGIPLLAVYGYAELRRTTHVKLYTMLNSQFMIWFVFTLTVLWWVGRNLFGV